MGLWIYDICQIIIEYFEESEKLCEWNYLSGCDLESFIVWAPHDTLPEDALLVFSQKGTSDVGSCLVAFNLSGTICKVLWKTSSDLSAISRIFQINQDSFLFSSGNRDTHLFDKSADGLEIIRRSPMVPNLLGSRLVLFTQKSYIVPIDDVVMFFWRIDHQNVREPSKPYFRLQFSPEKLLDIKLGDGQLFVFLFSPKESKRGLTSFEIEKIEDQRQQNTYYPTNSGEIHQYVGSFATIPISFATSFYYGNNSFLFAGQTGSPGLFLFDLTKKSLQKIWNGPVSQIRMIRDIIIVISGQSVCFLV